jgi:hypothetical protein
MTAPAGVAGSLVSGAHAAAMLRATPSPSERRAAGDLLRWWRSVQARCGPATGVRALADIAAAPLAVVLGYTLRRAVAVSETAWIAVLDGGDVAAPLVLTTWGGSLDTAWRLAVRHSLALHTRWCLLFNGTHLRVLDAGRTFARRHLEFELDAALEADAARLVVMLASAESLRPSPHASGAARLDAIVAASDANGLRVCGALRDGVHQAIEHLLAAFVERRQGRSPAPLDALYEQALTAVYRILFLCFAEARGLVPTWHPVYRDGYTVESLRAMAERADAPFDLWEAFQAISRLAHHGCEAGDLHVTPFNGRLFAPARAPLLERRGLSGGRVRNVVLALSTTVSPDGTRERVTYADLGVEELGAVYEGLLDYEPAFEPAGGPPGSRSAAGAPAVVLARSGVSRRKATGTFYTPRPITRFLVRQALQPLVADRSADRILALRVVDPAMGSGAFLVEACRFLARKYEAALVRDGQVGETDLSPADRAMFRRVVAQRCLFGVDLNPMAVHLARLSLWLTTLAADKPLSFLDHHLLAGDSLVGASPADIVRLVPGRARARRADDDQLPLFDPALLRGAAADVQLVRRDLEHTLDDSPAIVRRKEQQLTELAAAGALRSWKSAADLWCAAWFAPVAPSAGVYRSLVDEVLTARRVLSPATSARNLAEVRQVAEAHRFFHWPLEFPEVFFGPDGRELPDGGFDAVVGNPPWEMLRAERGARETHAASGTKAMLRFTRDSGLYHAQSQGHANQYQLFLERALSLARPGGRVALVLPSGLVHDHGCAALRQMLLGQCRVDSIVGFDNRAGIFPIHRSVRFVLLSAARGGDTARLRCRFGLHDPAVLDRLDDADEDAGAWFSFTPALLDRLTGPGLAIPDVRSSTDLAILEQAVQQHPPLGSRHGWHARFGRELNATDDRRHFTSGGRGLPIIEGKHLSPFGVNVGAATLRIAAPVAARLLDRARTFGRPRLAFRDVASATNRTTLIAAIVPAGSVTTHTVFCLRSRLDASDQLVLCALFNSYVANFLVRLRVSTHVTLAVMDGLPVPRPPAGSVLHGELLRCARAMAEDPSSRHAAASLHAAAARAYGLTESELAHVLASFPLVPHDERDAVLEGFTERLQDTRAPCRF